MMDSVEHWARCFVARALGRGLREDEQLKEPLIPCDVDAVRRRAEELVEEINKPLRDHQEAFSRQIDAEIEALPYKLDAESFDELAEEIACRLGASPGCDHTLRHTRASMEELNIPVEDGVRFVELHGGYCDCEVLMNVGPKLEQ